MNYEKLKQNFEKHGFHTTYFETKEEAADYLGTVIKGETVGIGGCMTAQEMKLDQILAKENTVIWHWLEPGEETRRRAREATVYLCSANGVSETGELVNIDGTGNRVSMTLFGPEKTYFLVGVNKIAKDLNGALERAKNIAAPKNSIRFQKKTPCTVPGEEYCHDCNSPDRICRATVILERPCSGMRVEVVFINQQLGF